MALQSYCREQVYWARDLIFVFVEHDEVGLEAWLSAYYGSPHCCIDAESLEAHGGAIIGATVLDVIGSRFSNLNIQFNMVNSFRYFLNLRISNCRSMEDYRILICSTCMFVLPKSSSCELVFTGYVENIPM